MSTFSDELNTLAADYTVDLAETPEDLSEAYKLRHQVYCRERHFEDVEGDEETDRFDGHAPHVVLRERGSPTVVGTARLVLPEGGLPVHDLCEPGLLRNLPKRSTGEVSRFAISKERKGGGEAAGLMRLALIRGLVRLSAKKRVTHWCAVMERPLLRLLRSSAIWFTMMGPVVEYHGLRQPCHISIDDMLARIADEQPALCDYLTDGGRYWQVQEPMRMAA